MLSKIKSFAKPLAFAVAGVVAYKLIQMAANRWVPSVARFLP